MITLLIPTMNRTDFLIRQLGYYRDVGFKGCICIGDSSDNVHTERTRQALATLSSLNITYREYPGVNDAECLKRLLDFVTTPYAAFVADDDFLIPSAMEQCTRFLDQHGDYGSAHGLALTISLKSDGAFGKVAGARRYGLPAIEGDSARQRILAHLGDYAVTLFGVHRIESWRRMYRDIGRLADKTFASELLPCCLSVILGKVKQLDCLYLVRQDHSQRYFLPGKSDWVRKPEWPGLYQTFVGLLAEALAKQDSIAKDEAKKVVERAFGSYLTGLLGANWRSQCGQPRADALYRLRQIARRIPGAAAVWRLLLSVKSPGRFETTPAALLDPAFPYHAEIMPIYRAMTVAPRSPKETL